MFNMKNKDLIMLGIIVGISLYFVGAMVSNVFDSSGSDLLAYKASGFLKLVGIGILTASMDRGTVIAYSDESLIDKEVLFDINRVAYKTSTFWIVDYQYVFGVVR